MNEISFDKNEYLNIVETFANDNDEIIFCNEGDEHAAIVLSRIFKYSNNSLKIYASSLNQSIVTEDEDYLNYLDSFIKKGGIVQVLIDHIPKKPSKAFKNLLLKSQIYSETVGLRVAQSKIKLNEKYVNFTVGDNNKFRLEIDPLKRTAYCSFNNIKFCTKLIDIFRDNFNIASQVLLNPDYY